MGSNPPVKHFSTRHFNGGRLLEFLFGIGDSTLGRNINAIGLLLAGILRIPERRVELSEDELHELCFDATEWPNRRPKRGQREFYSGKKRRHTIKSQAVVVLRRKRPSPGPIQRSVRIVAVSAASPRKVHDKRVYNMSRLLCLPEAKRTEHTRHIGSRLETPTRRPRGGELRAWLKARNRRIARRTVAEHAIGKLTLRRIAPERYRNPVRRHTPTMKNVVTTHNPTFA